MHCRMWCSALIVLAVVVWSWAASCVNCESYCSNSNFHSAQRDQERGFEVGFAGGADGCSRFVLWSYALYDHRTNDYIRRELQITGILDKIDKYRRNWFQHLQRMPQNRVPLKSYCYRPQGRRTIGRPKKRWREQL